MAEALWHWQELVDAANGSADDRPPDDEITGITIDSRSANPGDLFVALKDKRDGHDFVSSAFASGAAAALVSNDYQRKPNDGALIRVNDTLKSLESIGKAARARLDKNQDARVIAVTGSAGKTTTKEMLKAGLSRLGPTHAADKSFNNHWGVPLTLSRMPRDTKFGIFEIGMSNAGEIAPLVAMVRPNVAIVLNVLEAHLGQFPSTKEIADEKSTIFTGLVPNGTAIYNADSAHADILKQAAELSSDHIKTFGGDNNNDAWHSGVVGHLEDPLEPQRTRICFKDGSFVDCQLPAPGSHIALNAAAAMLAIREVGGDPQKAAAGFADLSPPEGRGARYVFNIPGGHFLLIDESYNANPGSMTAAIHTARQAVRDGYKRLVLVLGDMLELGEHSRERHLALKSPIDSCSKVLVFTVGEEMAKLHQALEPSQQGKKGATPADIENELMSAIQPDDVVMIKGSNGSKTWQLAAALRRHFAS